VEKPKNNKMKRAVAAAALFAALVAAASHLPCLWAPFHFDDERDIVYRREVALGAIEAAASSPFRAVTYATYAMDYKIGRGDPVPFHATNLILHAIAAALLLPVIIQLLGPSTRHSVAAATAAALWFAAHPAGVASVDYISGRAGLISALGGLAVILIALSGDFRGKWAAMAAALAFALFGKEDAAAIVAIAGVIHLIRGKRLLQLAPSLAVAVAYGIARLFTEPVVTGEAGHRASLASHLLLQPYVYCRAALSWLWPVGLSIDHHPPGIAGAGDPRIWICGFLLAAGAASAIWAARRSFKTTVIGAAWFVLAMAPGAVTPLADPLMENRWYFALAGLSVISAAAGSRLFARSFRAGVCASVIIVACMVGMTAHRSMRWTRPARVWANAVRLYPDAARPWSNYAQSEFSRGAIPEAAFAARRALNIEPADAIAWNTLGLSLKERGKYAEALRAYDRALGADPNMFVALTNRANLLAATDRLRDAESDWRRALRICPDYADALYGLAWTLAETGRKAEAMLHLERLLEINPKDEQARELLRRLKTR